MQLRRLRLERYKGYAESVEIELAPLTILVGANNSGKTALAQGIQLLAGGIAASEENTAEPLPLESGGVRHGGTFEDLVSGRSVHGWLQLSATLYDNQGELSFSTRIANVQGPTGSERHVWEWILRNGGKSVELEKQGFRASSPYEVTLSGVAGAPQKVQWRGVVPRYPNQLAQWLEPRAGQMRDWARRVRHLPCPRRLIASPFIPEEHSSVDLGVNGEKAPMALAVDDELRRSARQWYRKAFAVNIDVAAQGLYSELVAGTQDHRANVRLEQSGHGLSQVLPVVTMALTAHKAGPGVDVIEHPEAELHPAAHADVADLLIENLTGPERPMVVETHSEMVLLRARRWIAEGRLPANDVLVYWVQAEPGRGSTVKRIEIGEGGEVDGWPDGVFIEDYEEILAIQRASRPQQ